MSDAEHGLSPEHFAESRETIFPLDIDLLAARLRVFEASSDDMLDLVTEARGRWGDATDLYLNLPIDSFVDWHEKAEDFTQGGELYYKAGLLHGIDLAQSARSQHYVTGELEADDPEAFSQAVSYLKETYRDLDDAAMPNWVRQKNRELTYTGSDLMTLANATVRDNLLHRLDGENSAQDSSALHVGMVDGAIFVDALHAYSRQKTPVLPERSYEYAPTLNPERHLDLKSVWGGVVKHELESGELLSAAQFFEDWRKSQAQFEDGEKPISDLGGEQYHGRDRFIQVGQNTFVMAFEIEKIGYRRTSKQVMGAVAVVGAAMDYASYEVFDMKGPYLPLAAIAGVGLLAYFNRVRRSRAQRHAAVAGVPFTNN